MTKANQLQPDLILFLMDDIYFLFTLSFRLSLNHYSHINIYPILLLREVEARIVHSMNRMHL